MGVDDLKGRAKEAVGKLIGDRRLEHEGKIDQVTEKVKDVVDKVKGKLTGKDGR